MTNEKYEVNISIIIDEKINTEFINWLKSDLAHNFQVENSRILITQKKYTNYEYLNS